MQGCLVFNMNHKVKFEIFVIKECLKFGTVRAERVENSHGKLQKTYSCVTCKF